MPMMPPNSTLKKLDAEDCSIEKIHQSFFRPGIMLDLTNNKIKELPREETKRFLEEGGTFEYDEDIKVDKITVGGISLQHNPLEYPPAHVYEKGKDAVLSYVTKYANLMVDPDDISLLLMGMQERGKTSFANTMAGIISNAKEIKPEDRTQVFDYVVALVGRIKVGIIDLGGHEEYQCSLPLFCRDNGLQACIIKPSDTNSMAKLDDALGACLGKVMNGTVQPHIILVVSRTDEMMVKDKESKIADMQMILSKYLSAKRQEVMTIREKRLEELKENLKTVDQDLSIDDLDKSDRANLLRKKSSFQASISKQTFKINHPPNFNEDCITFVSSLTQDGFEAFRDNLIVAVSRLPKVKLQQHWTDPTNRLLSKDDVYITLDDFLQESGLEKDDLIEMLRALSALGRIVLTEMADGKLIIFPKLEKLSELMKSLLYHEMESNIRIFAQHKGLDPEVLISSYRQGKLPIELIVAMFVHICNQPKERDKKIKIDYTNFMSSPVDPAKRLVIASFLEKMQDLKMITLLDEKDENGLKVCFVPHLVKETSVDPLDWIAGHIRSSPFFDLSVVFKFETNVSNATFASSHASIRGDVDHLAKLIGANATYHTHKHAMVADLEHYEIILRQGEEAIVLGVNLVNGKILHEAVWIIMNDLVPKLGLNHTDCYLACSFDMASCNHGDYDQDPKITISPSYEAAKRNETRYRKKVKCPKGPKSVDLSHVYPKILANDVIRSLHPEGKPPVSPLDKNATIPQADYHEAQNLVSVLLSKPIHDATKISKHPAMLSNAEKFFISIQSVRQLFDTITTCDSKKGHRDCGVECKREMAQFVEFVTQIEKNGPIVTVGEWRKAMTLFGSNQNFPGDSHSVAELTRGVRNMVAHKDPNDIDLTLFSTARSHFHWLIMHNFAFWAQNISKDPTLMTFAESLFQSESEAYQQALMEGTLMKCPQTFFKVKVTENSFEEETCFLLDASQKPNEFLNKVRQTIPLPKEIKWKIVYKGVEEAGHIPPLTPDTELVGDNSLQILTNTSTHLIHLSPHPCFKVKVTKAGKDEETSLYFDVKQNPKGFLPNKLLSAVSKKIPLPKPAKEKKWKIVYLGMEGALDPPIDPGTDLEADSLLKLDNSAIHLVHVFEE